VANKVEIIINADGSRAIKALTDVGATARETGKANADAAKATALAAKFAGDTVKSESVKIIQAREKERVAASEYGKLQALLRKGAIDEATGTTAAAAAYQRLTAAKLLTAKASEVHIAAMKGEGHEWATLREHFGGGLSAAGSFAGNIPALAAFASAAGALSELKSAVTETLEFGEAMKRTSDNTGIAIGTLSVMHYAAKVTGGDFDALASSAAKMGAAIGNAADGNDKKAAALLKSLGLNAKELANSQNGVEVALKRVAEAMSATELPARRLELAKGLLGKAGTKEVHDLMELGLHWDEYMKKTKDAGRYMDELSAEKLEAVNQKLKGMEEHIDGAKVALAEGFTPALGQMIDVIEGGKGSMDSMNDLGKTLGKTFAGLADIIYSAAAAAEILFAASEGSGLTEAGRRDTAAANRLLDKAQAMHDIAFGPDHGNTQRMVEGVGKTGLAGMGGEIVGGPPKRPGEDRFKGIGDLTGGADKEAQKRLKGFEAELHQEELLYNVSNKAAFDFWEVKKSAFAAGSDEYNAIVAKQAQLAEQGAKSASEKIKRFKEEQLRSSAELPPDMSKVTTGMARDNARTQQDRYDTNYELYAIEQKTAAQLEEMAIRQMMRDGLTQEVAALKLAAVHTRSYGAELARPEAEKKNFETNPLLSNNDVDQQKKIDELTKRIAELQGGRQIQIQQDSYAVQDADRSAVHGATEALQEFSLAATNAREAMKGIASGAFNSTNSAILKMLTEPRSQTRGEHVFGQAGHEIFSNVAENTLKGTEGKLLQLFPKGLQDRLGLGGKKDGSSAANALWVQMAGAGGSGLPKIPGMTDGMGSLSDMAKMSGGSSGGDSSSGGGGFLSGAAGLAMHMLIPGFADGVDNFGGGVAMVGERGPEILNLPKGSSVTPNSKLGRGATYTENHYYDNRGATDPAAFEAAMHRVVSQRTPGIAAMTIQAFDAGKQRRPPGMR